ncbi:MAG TPA: methyltransferase domain-containing protein [Methanospirillum sp.]|nr:methyltransferase domain-containing protein [Methanospirillum sp.]
MSLLFAEMGYQVTGVDLSGAMIEVARRKAEESGLSIDMGMADAEYLPYGDESFDVIVNRHLLWTLLSPETALQDWHRVLKKGGRVLIIDGVWNDRSLMILIKRWISDGLIMIFEPGGTHHCPSFRSLLEQLPHGGGMSPEILETYLTHAGFSTISFRGLMRIRKIQKSRLPWYRRIALGNLYYFLTAFKNRI